MEYLVWTWNNALTLLFSTLLLSFGKLAPCKQISTNSNVIIDHKDALGSYLHAVFSAHGMGYLRQGHGSVRRENYC